MRCLSSTSTSEIFRRTNLFFKNVDKLKQLASFSTCATNHNKVPIAKGQTTIFSRAGMILGSLTEYNARKICGDALYGAGLQNYVQGRVIDKRFWKNTLSGKLDETGRKWLSGRDPQFFEPIITIERSSKRPRISGHCGCSLASEGSICTHMAALLIAWVRKPQDFVEGVDYETIMSEFDEIKGAVTESLRELTECIEGGSSKTDDLRLLQKTYSKLRLWVDEVKEANYDGTVEHAAHKEKDLIREFSKTIHDAAFAIMTAFESKYRIGVTDVYNRNTVSTFAKVFELFVESADHNGVGLISRPKKGRKRGTKPITHSPYTTRTWDSLVENFSGR